jgi:hypothetical protein
VVRYSRFFSIAAAVILVLNLVAISGSGVDAAQRGGSDQCVAVSGGNVLNETVLDVVADGGTAISDSSGGTGNLAVAAESGGGNNNNRNNRNNNNNNNNRNNNKRNNWTSQSLESLEEILFQQDTASAGNAGVATASADGGAVSIGDINSGGNAGNAITVGNTVCPGAAPVAAGGGDKGGGTAGGGNVGGGGRGGKVMRLPSTGAGEVEAGTSGSLALALGALGMAVLAVAFRDDRRPYRPGAR